MTEVERERERGGGKSNRRKVAGNEKEREIKNLARSNS
jgi:hypothetical protein